MSAPDPKVVAHAETHGDDTTVSSGVGPSVTVPKLRALLRTGGQ